MYSSSYCQRAVRQIQQLANALAIDLKKPGRVMIRSTGYFKHQLTLSVWEN